jgi:hypothetical protein
MLSFLIGNNHPQLAVLFDNVDALDINLLKPLFFVLKRESRKEKYRAKKRGNKSVNF